MTIAAWVIEENSCEDVPLKKRQEKKDQNLKKTLKEAVQSCLTLCNLMDYSLPGSSVHGII